MSDIRLPQRPMVELAPPIDGLEQVRGEAGRRRRRRAGIAAAGVTTAAGVAVVVALSGAAGGVDMLKPAPPAGPRPVASTPAPQRPGEVSVDAKGRRHVRQPTPRLVTGKTSGRAPSGRGHVVATIPSNPNATPPRDQIARSQQPTLSRWQSTYTDSPARECAGSEYGDTSGTLKNAVGWCLDAMATPVSGGERLHLRLCRDSTGGGALTFDGTREVDLSVRQGSRTVWDWATLHPGGSGGHQITEPANGCMNWAVVWPDVTTAGAPAGHGNFTFVGTSTAEETQGNPSVSAAFGY
jgi:hypothetical protein